MLDLRRALQALQTQREGQLVRKRNLHNTPSLASHNVQLHAPNSTGYDISFSTAKLLKSHPIAIWESNFVSVEVASGTSELAAMGNGFHLLHLRLEAIDKHHQLLAHACW